MSILVSYQTVVVEIESEREKVMFKTTSATFPGLQIHIQYMEFGTKIKRKYMKEFLIQIPYKMIRITILILIFYKILNSFLLRSETLIIEQYIIRMQRIEIFYN